MKTFNFLTLLVIMQLQANWGNAQNLIAVQNNSTPKFYQQVDDAITNAVDGDTIFIPGGSWNITKAVDKRLHIIGVGHHPDSTKVTFPTTLNGNITLKGTASNGSVTGILLAGQITGSTDPVSSYTVSRCRIKYGITSYPTQSNFTFIENIIESNIYGQSTPASNCSFFNNIITSSSAIVNSAYANSAFKNNIFLYKAYWNGAQYSLPISGQFLIFQNNIFFYTEHFTGITNSTAKNNLFIETNPIYDGTTNVGVNNIVNQTQSSIFVNQTGNAFSYSHDYHLQASSPGKNAGTDGTDVGIYGGFYPWKEGSVPANPHFQSVKISPKTDDSGNLNVRIKVAAQDH